MKKIFSAFLIIAALTAVSVFAEEVKPVTVTLNYKQVDCASYGQEATIVEGRTLVPLRAIFEALGASVEWDQTTKTVTSKLGETEVSLTIGADKLVRNGEELSLDVPAMIMNGRTLVPVRAVSESFGVYVEWDKDTRTVVLLDGVLAYNAYLDNTLASLVPKSDLDREILVTAGGLPVSAAMVRSGAFIMQSNRQDFNDESTIKELENYYSQNAALVNFAYMEGITLDEADINLVKSDIFSLQLQLGDRYEEAFAKTPYTQHFYYLNTSLYSAVYSKLVETYANSENKAVYNQVLDYFEKNDYVRAKHILIQFPSNHTEEQRKETFSKALDVLVEVNAMKDISEFDALVEKYNEDPGMNSNPDGYYFTYGEMVKPFEQATYALEVGKTSSIVETDYGFHIILRLPLENENLVNTPIYKSAVGNVITETLIDVADGYEVEYADNYAERVEDFKNECEAMLSEMN